VDKKTSIQRARELRNNLTDAEQKLWYALRGKQIKGYKFRRQVTIGLIRQQLRNFGAHVWDFSQFPTTA
jgi:very-short-patch-repair endonuclease